MKTPIREVPVAAIPAPLLRLFAPIDNLLRDPQISRVLVDGPDRVFIERDGHVERTAVQYGAHALAESLEGLARRARKPFDEQRPYLEALLKDGTRFLAIRAPAVEGGPLLSISRPVGGLTAPDLLQAQVFPSELRGFLGGALSRGLNVAVVSPSTSSRARTLEALSGLMSESARVVVVEEFPEIELSDRDFVRLSPRRGDGEGGVTTGELLYCAGRMAVERVLLSEVRRTEAWDVVSLLAERMAPLALGLPGVTAEDAIARLEALARAAASTPRDRAVPGLLGAGLDVAVVLGREGRRMVIRSVEMVEVAGGAIKATPVFRWRGGISGHLEATERARSLEAEWTGRQPVASTRRAPGGPATLNGPPMASVLDEVRAVAGLDARPAQPPAAPMVATPLTSAPLVPRPPEPASEPLPKSPTRGRSTSSGDQPTAQVPIPELPDELKGLDDEPEAPLGPPVPTGSEAGASSMSVMHGPMPSQILDPPASGPVSAPAVEAEVTVGEPEPRSPSSAGPSFGSSLGDASEDEASHDSIPHDSIPHDSIPHDSIMVQYDPSQGSLGSVHDTEIARGEHSAPDASVAPSIAGSLVTMASDQGPPSLGGSVGEGSSADGGSVDAERSMTGAQGSSLDHAASPATPDPAPRPLESRTTAVRPIQVPELSPTDSIVMHGEEVLDSSSMAGTVPLAKVTGELAPTMVHDAIDDDALRAALGRLPEDDLTEAQPIRRGPEPTPKAEEPTDLLGDPDLSKKTFSQVLKNIQEDDGDSSSAAWPPVDTETSDMPEALSRSSVSTDDSEGGITLEPLTVRKKRHKP